MTRAARPLAALALLAGALALAAPAARAQRGPFDAPPPQQVVAVPPGGTELFRALLDRDEIKPVTLREFQTEFQNQNRFPRTTPPDLIVVAIGSPSPLFNDPYEWVRNAVASNGAALLATDSQAAVYRHDQLNAPAAEFSGNLVNADWQDCHKNTPSCPYAVPVSPDEVRLGGRPPGPVWGLFRGLNKLATNQPTHLVMRNDRFDGEYRYPLARLPRSSFDANWGQRMARQPVLAVGGDGDPQQGESYSFLAVADSSIFTNQMLMEEGADNLKFAVRTVEYLRGPDGRRKRCLFFENGRVVESFDGLRSALAKPKPKIPPEAMPNIGPLFGKHQDKLVQFLDAKVDELQTNDVPHRALVGRSGSEAERRTAAKFVEVAAVLGAVAALVYLLRRTGRARQPLDVPPPPNAGAGVASTGPPGVFDRRQKELVRRNNLYEPVRDLMREFFDAVGAPPNPGPRIPALEISDAVRKPESLRQAIRDMWRIAYGPPQPISAQRWFELEPYFDRLRKAHADGKWRFVTDE